MLLQVGNERQSLREFLSLVTQREISESILSIISQWNRCV